MINGENLTGENKTKAVCAKMAKLSRRQNIPIYGKTIIYCH
jgi:hypothetical protein